jgi:tetratricopeptide (TPR) repeat protein
MAEPIKVVSVSLVILILGLLSIGVAAQEPQNLILPTAEDGKTLTPEQGGQALKYMMMGLKFSEAGDDEKAVEAFRQYIRLLPGSANGHHLLGSTYQAMGRDQEAVVAYREAIRLKPNYAEAYTGLGQVYGKMGRYSEATVFLKESIRHKPNDVLTHYTLGLIYLCLGNRGDALQEYQILQTLDQEKAKKFFNQIYK